MLRQRVSRRRRIVVCVGGCMSARTSPAYVRRSTQTPVVLTAPKRRRRPPVVSHTIVLD